ncbi:MULTISPECIES: hypothetical protein [Streptomyces]|uniref:hypothetical protein n=1 Tax=Streptomyces TaxID=1883 RepID=UPI0015FFCFCF|nr:hypothetical protein [Streptomyces murinus]MBA9050790.1 hypothetical protein [Streptomyces murinus]
MPLTDSYGQNIPYPTLTDKPNAQSLAEGLVSNMVPKLVMSFASATARGATIKTPVEGMITWLKDVDRLEVFDGASWVSFAFGTNSWKTIGLTSGWTNSNVSLGPFQYRVVNLFGENTLMFRGGITKTGNYPGTLPSYFTLNSTALPAGARPAIQRTITVTCSDVSSARIALKMDVTTGGLLNLYGFQSDTKPPWVGFDGTFTSL